MNFEYAEQYLATGSNLIINAMAVEYLERLARVARASGAHLTIVGAMAIEYMIQVAHAGGGNVTFDVASYKVRD